MGSKTESKNDSTYSLLQFQILNEEKENIRQFCDNNGETMSNFIRNCIDFFVSRDTTPTKYARTDNNHTKPAEKTNIDTSEFAENFNEIKELSLNTLNAIETLRREISISAIKQSRTLTETLNIAIKRLEGISK